MRVVALLTVVLALVLTACGDDDDDGGAESTAPANTTEQEAPATSEDESDESAKKLVAGATRELKTIGGWDRWAVQKIESAGDDDLIVYTDLYPDADADPAAPG